MTSSGNDLHAARLALEGSNVLSFLSRRVDAGEPQRSAAVLDVEKQNRESASDTVSSLGYKAFQFDCSEDLMTALMHGSRFDLFLAGFDGPESRLLSGAKMLRSVLGPKAPLLLMVREVQLGAVSSLIKGATEDFIVMPCKPVELEARVMAFKGLSTSAELYGEFRCGAYHFQALGRVVSFNDRQIRLQPIEFDLALHLFRNPGLVHSRKALFDAVWTRARTDETDTRTLDVHIARLRRKLEIGEPNGCELQSVRNIGYRLNFYADGAKGALISDDRSPFGVRETRDGDSYEGEP
ncbi:DNA-binding response OmpR family regulator [Variovorax boronicumulans]|uniref:DNA-binding response OmpR family regulator n=1 Tax=Variovorax boronicumulans TaxID=436515 RepID=A0AAW8DTQ7_9BURK|nr:response regulator transcription factor [Variovorax boronicumulans]MDP9877692.1 DNA-binding response OmpR family regulator [Variovorax boronicumulans]MDP9922976.1 DNA-binding response OmpR family regulator [Variovorax boronicumulans]